jgi:hypothetical protein
MRYEKTNKGKRRREEEVRSLKLFPEEVCILTGGNNPSFFL